MNNNYTMLLVFLVTLVTAVVGWYMVKKPQKNISHVVTRKGKS